MRLRGRRAVFAVGAAIAVLVVVAYWRAPRNAFHLDDFPNIVDNDAVHMERFSAEALSRAVRDSYLAGRVLPNLSFAVDWWRGGGEPRAFLQTNVALHALVAVLLFVALYLALRANGALAGRNGARPALVGAGIGAALWAAHPIQVQAVSYVVQRMASMAALFALASVMAFALWRVRGRVAWLAVAAGAYAAALATKENTVVVPLLWLFVEHAIATPRRRLLDRPVTKVAWIALALGAAYIAIDLWLVGGPLRAWAEPSYGIRHFTLDERVLTEPRVIARHLGQLLWFAPTNFGIEHDFALSTSLFRPAGTALAWLGLVAWCVVGIALLSRERWRLVGLGLLWVPTTLAVESSFIGLELVFEHRMYLPTMGLALLAAFGVATVAMRSRRALQASIAVGVVVVALCAASTHARLGAWQTEIRLWESAVAFAPGTPRAHYNLAHAHRLAGQYPEAMASYEAAVALNPEHVLAWTNLGALRNDLGMVAPARLALEAALRADPSHPEALYNLGRLHLTRLGDPDRAIALFERAIAERPDYGDAYANLGAALNQRRQYARTIAALTVPDVPADHPQLLFNLAVAYGASGQGGPARALLERLEGLDPGLAARLRDFLSATGR